MILSVIGQSGSNFRRPDRGHKIALGLAGTISPESAYLPRGWATISGVTLMRKILAIVPAAVLGLLPATASADHIAVTGAVGGAATGAIVGGPVGAIVGGVIGAIIGTAVEPPPAEVVSYVQAQTMEPVYLSGNLVVGATIPAEVVLQPVPPDVYVAPDGRVYGYAVVNGHPVVVDMQTRAVVAIG
jgi:hypothetical protein